MTPIRDLIDIPERVHRDDFVLRIAEGVAQPAETLRTYVVTPQLADAFDRALGVIEGALASGSSKAAYLHGSFGSGKSHFMAVLHLLLQQHAEARAAEGLEGVVTRHGDWLAGRRFLLAPYHMIGKPSLEAPSWTGRPSRRIRRTGRGSRTQRGDQGGPNVGGQGQSPLPSPFAGHADRAVVPVDVLHCEGCDLACP